MKASEVRRLIKESRIVWLHIRDAKGNIITMCDISKREARRLVTHALKNAVTVKIKAKQYYLQSGGFACVLNGDGEEVTP